MFVMSFFKQKGSRNFFLTLVPSTIGLYVLAHQNIIIFSALMIFFLFIIGMPYRGWFNTAPRSVLYGIDLAFILVVTYIFIEYSVLN